ncbi:glycosyltransferase family 2 protein [Orrella sp. 11846]|uniref:glycosyltransferase family 2 protein n=1 Tax=Orrella sp. 11846 TaxID=3409913 RepID=UPI003B5B5EB1
MKLNIPTSAQFSEKGKYPLVSIGVPVRNGGESLAESLQLLVSQTYPNIEIIISDNASEDATAEIIRSFANANPYIRVYHQKQTLSAIQNFRFVFDQSRGQYFMWASDDDRRDCNYVELLVQALESNSSACLAFGQTYLFTNHENWRTNNTLYAFDYTFSSTLSLYARALMFGRRDLFFNIYGLIRTQALKKYDWGTTEDYMPDLPIMVFLAMNGEFLQANHCPFYYYYEEKSSQERSLDNSLRKIKPCPEIRVSWSAATTAVQAMKPVFKTPKSVFLFLQIYASRFWRRIKPKIFELSPDFVVTVYRKLFKK